ncbi:MAG: imidazole glycerol phosphate synthase subunit HisH [Duodenibacillus sp.]|nr:imidazole glycerol phosphate synthase subunit HisH [Duodenibacillus sp.]
MSSIAVVDYGSGNLHSVLRAARAAVAGTGAEVVLTSDPAAVDAADRVIFPGQGAMGDCMKHLSGSGLKESIEAALRAKPVFAICIGLQMLFEKSDEDDCAGLGLYRGKVLRFPEAALEIPSGGKLKVPQMGWNTVQQRQRHPLFEGVDDGAWFYFVHSYFVAPEDDTLTAATASYGLPFVCAVARDNVFATQFHPEKSAGCGLRLIHNFARWNP